MPHDLTREYSKRLGVLTREQLQAALDRFGLGELVDAQAAPGGLFGQNVMITSTEGDFVLRGAPHHEWQFPWERYFSRVIHERTRANAPWPYEIEPSKALFGWQYAMMPRLPGLSLADPDVRRSITNDERVQIGRAMGEHLALMQDATWAGPGIYTTADEVVPIEQPFDAWFVARAREWLARCREASAATTDVDVAWVERIIERASDVLAVPFTPALVHTDYSEGNVTLVREGETWRVTGVFDLGDAYAGDGEYDLARLACWYGPRDPAALLAFIDAYASLRPPRPGFAERISLYILADRLIIWEYGQRNGIWFTPDLTLRSWAEPFVELEIEGWPRA